MLASTHDPTKRFKEADKEIVFAFIHEFSRNAALLRVNDAEDLVSWVDQEKLELDASCMHYPQVSATAQH